MAYYESIKDLIGNTPLVRLHKLEEKYKLHGRIFAKLEMFNPAGSIKDRAALNMVKEALKDGRIKEGSTLIEPTSGNTGIGLALVATIYNLRLILTMPDSMSIERQILLKARGAELILTPGALGMQGAVAKAEELAKNIPNSMIVGQFYNPDNYKAHIDTTAKELYDDLLGKVDIVIAGIGTGGTISGVAQGLKKRNVNVEAIGVEPFESPLISKGTFGPHKIQGIGANFIPENYRAEFVDRIVTIKSDDAISMTKELNQVEAILAGISAGANLKAAIDEAKLERNKDKNIVAILPDTGEHYLSMGIF